MLRSVYSSISESRVPRTLLILLLSVFLMSFSTEAQAQSSAKELKKEQRKERKAEQRAEAEKKRMAALYADADFHDEDEDELVAIEIKTSEPKVRPRKKRTSSSSTLNETTMVEPAAYSLSTVQEIEQYAFSLEGIPYRYGGMDTKGFDCSGFSHHVFSKSGVSIPRTAQAQYDAAQIIPMRKAKKGDLVFFGKSKRKISHVGIVISDKGEPLRMIHSASSGGIMTTTIDSSEYWRTRLHSSGRYLDDADIRAAR